MLQYLTFQNAGFVVVGLVIIQLLLSLYSSILQSFNASKQSRMALELIRQRIATQNAAREKAEKSGPWSGNRKFVVDRKVVEADNTASFYLVPHDKKPLPQFKPGQYLTFSLNITGQTKPVIRCYSLSDSPNPNYYRVTIKRVPPPRGNLDAPAGLVSNYFHDQVNAGDILDVKAPGGHFFLDPTLPNPIVLIGGGVGITPMLSMIGGIAQVNPQREVYFFYGVRFGREHAMKSYLEDLSERHANFKIFSCYSDPRPEDVEGRDYQFAERVSLDLLQRVLESNKFEYYLCGPPPMMESLLSGLAEWGVPDGRVFKEAFGPASGKAIKKAKEPSEASAPSKKSITVEFSRSDKSCEWSDDYESLLDFAEANGVSIESGCRAGNCGTCIAAIKDGEFEWTNEPGCSVDEGSCLTCVAVPKGNIVVDA